MGNTLAVLHSAQREDEGTLLPKLQKKSWGGPKQLKQLKSFRTAQSMWHIAAARGHVLVLEHLVHSFGPQGLEEELPPALLESINQTDRKGRTPLAVACKRGQEGSVRLLLSVGANPLLVDRDGNTPLHHAARNGNSDVVQLLLEATVPLDLQRSQAAAQPATYRRSFITPTARQIEALLPFELMLPLVPVMENSDAEESTDTTLSSRDSGHSEDEDRGGQVDQGEQERASPGSQQPGEGSRKSDMFARGSNRSVGEGSCKGVVSSPPMARGRRRSSSSSNSSKMLAASSGNSSNSNMASQVSSQQQEAGAGNIIHLGAGPSPFASQAQQPMQAQAISDQQQQQEQQQQQQPRMGNPTGAASAPVIPTTTSMGVQAASAASAAAGAVPRALATAAASAPGQGSSTITLNPTAWYRYITHPPRLRQRFIDTQNASGFTALHFAVAAGNADAVATLLASKANPSLANHVAGAGWIAPAPRRSNPLHLAAARGDINVARMIVQSYLDSPSDVRRPDPRLLRDIDGYQPYMLAGNNGHWLCAQLLLNISRDDTHTYWSEYLHLGASPACPFDVPRLAVLAAKALQEQLVTQVSQLADQHAALMQAGQGPAASQQLSRAQSGAQLQLQQQGSLHALALPSFTSASGGAGAGAGEGATPRAGPPAAAMGAAAAMAASPRASGPDMSRKGSLELSAAGAGAGGELQGLVSRASSTRSRWSCTDEGGIGTCELCFERPRMLRITSCTHGMCASCSRRVVLMCSGKPAAPSCPFCLRHIAGFSLASSAAAATAAAATAAVAAAAAAVAAAACSTPGSQRVCNSAGGAGSPCLSQTNSLQLP